MLWVVLLMAFTFTWSLMVAAKEGDQHDGEVDDLYVRRLHEGRSSHNRKVP